MSCPPQLSLTLPGNSTSFKRSFEEFGFDLESPVGAGAEPSGSGHSNTEGNEPNKRARSESKDSPRSERRDESSSSGASQDGAASPIGASPVEAPESVESGLSASRPLADTAQRTIRTSPDPPRIPTPNIEDVEMPHYVPIDDAAQPPSPPTQAAAPAEPSTSDEFRETMERVGAFDSEISALRRSISRSPPIAPSSASPPTLPPLEELPPLVDGHDHSHAYLLPSAQPTFSAPHITPSFNSRNRSQTRHVQSGWRPEASTRIFRDRRDISPEYGVFPRFRDADSLPRNLGPRRVSARMATALSEDREERFSPRFSPAAEHVTDSNRHSTPPRLPSPRSASPLFSIPIETTTETHADGADTSDWEMVDEGLPRHSPLPSPSEVAHAADLSAWTPLERDGYDIVLPPPRDRRTRPIATDWIVSHGSGFGWPPDDTYVPLSQRRQQARPREWDDDDDGARTEPNTPPESSLGLDDPAYHTFSLFGADPTRSRRPPTIPSSLPRLSEGDGYRPWSSFTSEILQRQMSTDEEWLTRRMRARDAAARNLARETMLAETALARSRSADALSYLGLREMPARENDLPSTAHAIGRERRETPDDDATIYDPHTAAERASLDRHYPPPSSRASQSSTRNATHASIRARDGPWARARIYEPPLFERTRDRDSSAVRRGDGVTEAGQSDGEMDMLPSGLRPSAAREAHLRTRIFSSRPTRPISLFDRPGTSSAADSRALRSSARPVRPTSHDGHIESSSRFDLPVPSPIDLSDLYREPFGQASAGPRPASPSPDVEPPSSLSGPLESDTDLPSSYRNINIDAYGPGLFRASLQRNLEMERTQRRARWHDVGPSDTLGPEQFRNTLRDSRRAEGAARYTDPRSATGRASLRQSNPPALPPLRFETRGEASTENRPTGATSSAASSTRTAPSRATLYEGSMSSRYLSILGARTEETRARALLAHYGTDDPTPPHRVPAAGQASGLRPRDATSQARHDMHSLFANRARMEASRIEEDSASQPGREQGFSEAIEVLRADGLSSTRQQQLIDRFRRESADQRRRAAALWGDVDGESDGRLPSEATLRARRRRVIPGGAPTTTDTRSSSTTARRQSTSHSPTRGGDAVDERLRQGLASRETARARFAQRAAQRHAARDSPFGGRDSDSLFSDFPRLELLNFRPRRGRPFGDYMRDEDFDSSYEGLLSISAALGEARPRATPDHVIASLPTGFYKDWATPDSDARCPICLDDYKSLDPLLKLTDCSHWLHKECLEQWLHGASTCPVCRHKVKSNHQHDHSSEDAGPSGSHPPSRRDDEDEDDRGTGPLEALWRPYDTPPWR